MASVSGREGTLGGVLTGEAIKKLNIISGGTETSFRYASYDLRIGEIIDPDGRLVQEYVLPPRGIVEVISRERVRVPDDLVGHAMVKTSLCNEGILALGIGIIDPGWEGRISSYLINFGKNGHHLGGEDVFLRTTFQRMEGSLPAVKRIIKSDLEIFNDRKKATVSLIGPSFLNLSEELDKLSREHEDKRWLKILAYVGAVSLLLGFLGFCLTWFTSGLAGKPQTSSMVVSQPLASEIEAVRGENSDLQRRLSQLEAEVAASALRPAVSGPRKLSDPIGANSTNRHSK